MSEPLPPARGLSAPAVVAALSAIAAVELVAIRGADADFPLVDPFHAVVLGLALAVIVAAIVPHVATRRTLLALVVSLGFGLAAIERFSAGRPIGGSRIAASDDVLLRYTYRPGAPVPNLGSSRGMIVNADGLWDVPHAVPKPPDVDRVVVLGDSVPNDPTIAYAQRFPHRLEEMLAAMAPAGRRPEVVNVSCEGYNTLQEERLFERVGRRYQPDLVVLAYVLNDPFLQNGAYRRVGNSFFAFQAAPLVTLATGGSMCTTFARLADGYAFDLVVRNSLERLRLVTAPDHVPVLVAALPVVERFDDPICLGLYDRALGVARDQGFATLRLVDAFRGDDFHAYLKPGNRFDVTHPTQPGHEKMARAMADAIAPMLWRAPPSPP